MSATLPGNIPAPRVDLYAYIHKALRCVMCDTLARLGTVDATDPGRLGATLDAVDSLLAQLRRHLSHENDFFHTAIEARRPGGSARTAADDSRHLDAVADLEDESRALRHRGDAQRAQLAASLYRHVAAFIGQTFVHMQVEETHNNAALWELYTDDELVEVRDRLIARLDPAEIATVTRWMAVALNDAELAQVFGQIGSRAPQATVRTLLEIVRRQLDPARSERLARSIVTPPAAA